VGLLGLLIVFDSLLWSSPSSGRPERRVGAMKYERMMRDPNFTHAAKSIPQKS
jgi:hypothetical protein